MRPRLEALVRTVADAGTATGSLDMLDQKRLARMLARELSDAVAPRLDELLRHPNAAARRVACEAVARGRFWRPGVLDAIVECLAHSVASVRYEAACALAHSDTRTPAVVAALRTLAADVAHDETINMSDDAQRARVAAAKALAQLGATRA